MSAMIRGGSTGKVLLTRGLLFYQPERSPAAISHSASKQFFKLSRRDFISSYLPVYRSSRARVHGENVRERQLKMYSTQQRRDTGQTQIS